MEGGKLIPDGEKGYRSNFLRGFFHDLPKQKTTNRHHHRLGNGEYMIEVKDNTNHNNKYDKNNNSCRIPDGIDL